MRKAGVAHSKSSKDMESHVFLKAKTRDEYLSLVARLIIHFQDTQKKKSQASASDPMNALQSLTGGPTPGAAGIGMPSRGPGQSPGWDGWPWHHGATTPWDLQDGPSWDACGINSNSTNSVTAPAGGIAAAATTVPAAAGSTAAATAAAVPGTTECYATAVPNSGAPTATPAAAAAAAAPD